jgi:hypothetical protein
MVTWPACVIALGFAVARSAPAQTLDFKESVRRSEQLLANVSEIARWVGAVKPTELNLQYDEGHNLAFWIEEADLHTARVDSALRVYRTSPRLSKLVDLIIEGHELVATINTLSRELSDCHTCDNTSAKRAGSWAGNVRDLQRQLAKNLIHLESEMGALVVRAEFFAEMAAPERRDR